MRAATEAEASLDAARRRIEALEFKNLELERLRGWKGVFGGAKALSTSSKKTRDDENETLSVANRDYESRNDAPLLARRNSAFESLSARRGRGSSSSSSSSVPRAYRRGGGGDSGGGFVAAATAAAAAAEADRKSVV